MFYEIKYFAFTPTSLTTPNIIEEPKLALINMDQVCILLTNKKSEEIPPHAIIQMTNDYVYYIGIDIFNEMRDWMIKKGILDAGI